MYIVSALELLVRSPIQKNFLVHLVVNLVPEWILKKNAQCGWTKIQNVSKSCFNKSIELMQWEEVVFEAMLLLRTLAWYREMWKLDTRCVLRFRHQLWGQKSYKRMITEWSGNYGMILIAISANYVAANQHRLISYYSVKIGF